MGRFAGLIEAYIKAKQNVEVYEDMIERVKDDKMDPEFIKTLEEHFVLTTNMKDKALSDLIEALFI